MEKVLTEPVVHVRIPGIGEWEQQEDDYIIKNHKRLVAAEIGENLGRTEGSIQSRLDHLGLEAKESLSVCHEEIVSLAKRGKMNYEIAKQLGRPKEEVRAYMKEQGIEIEPSVSMRKVAEENGIDDLVANVHKNMTFKEWFVYWYQTFREQNIRQVSKDKYKVTFAHLCSQSISSIKLSELTRADAQKYLNWYGATHSKSTVYDHLSFLKKCIGDAKEDGLVETNPFVNITPIYKEQKYDVKKQKELRDQKKWLEMDEYTKLKYYFLFNLEQDYKTPPFEMQYGKKNAKGKSAYHQVIHTAIFVALKTGARFSEILGLTREDVLFATSELNVDKTWDYKYGTGFMQTKNLASIRKVFLDKETLNILGKYTDWLDAEKVTMEQNTLFIQQDVIPYSTTFNTRLRIILNELDIEPVTMHKLRHTQASILIAKGVPIQLVAKRLGHTDTTMIRKVYGHLLQETEEDGNRMIAGLL